LSAVTSNHVEVKVHAPELLDNLLLSGIDATIDAAIIGGYNSPHMHHTIIYIFGEDSLYLGD
jgi:hypothetical protein